MMIITAAAAAASSGGLAGGRSGCCALLHVRRREPTQTLERAVAMMRRDFYQACACCGVLARGHQAVSMSCEECGCPISRLGRMGLSYGYTGENCCSRCGSPESRWPKSFDKDPIVIAQQIASNPYWSGVLGGQNDTSMEHSNPVCGHQCKVSDFAGIQMWHVCLRISCNH
jgi:hypothetical protein